MKNKYEGFCYVCGSVVEEEKGVAIQVPRQIGDPGWGGARWAVAHPDCEREAKEIISRHSAPHSAGKEA